MNRPEKVIIAVLVLALGLFIYARFKPHTTTTHNYPTVTHVQPVAAKKPTPPLDPSLINIPRLAELTNQDRIDAGLVPLSETASMDRTASDKCNDMVVRNYYGHIDPGNINFTEFFLPEYGTAYTYVGENMLLSYHEFTSADLVNTAFMGHPEHRANILRPDYRYVGFAVCHAPNLLTYADQLIVVEHFLAP